MDLEPHGWYSPEQTAQRSVQRLELWAARHRLPWLPGAATMLRVLTLAVLRAVQGLQTVDRRVAASLTRR